MELVGTVTFRDTINTNTMTVKTCYGWRYLIQIHDFHHYKPTTQIRFKAYVNPEERDFVMFKQVQIVRGFDPSPISHTEYIEFHNQFKHVFIPGVICDKDEFGRILTGEKLRIEITDQDYKYKSIIFFKDQLKLGFGLGVGSRVLFSTGWVLRAKKGTWKNKDQETPRVKEIIPQAERLPTHILPSEYMASLKNHPQTEINLFMSNPGAAPSDWGEFQTNPYDEIYAQLTSPSSPYHASPFIFKLIMIYKERTAYLKSLLPLTPNSPLRKADRMMKEMTESPLNILINPYDYRAYQVDKWPELISNFFRSNFTTGIDNIVLMVKADKGSDASNWTDINTVTSNFNGGRTTRVHSVLFPPHFINIGRETDKPNAHTGATGQRGQQKQVTYENINDRNKYILFVQNKNRYNNIQLTETLSNIDYHHGEESESCYDDDTASSPDNIDLYQLDSAMLLAYRDDTKHNHLSYIRKKFHSYPRRQGKKASPFKTEIIKEADIDSPNLASEILSLPIPKSGESEKKGEDANAPETSSCLETPFMGVPAEKYFGKPDPKKHLKLIFRDQMNWNLINKLHRKFVFSQPLFNSAHVMGIYLNTEEELESIKMEIKRTNAWAKQKMKRLIVVGWYTDPKDITWFDRPAENEPRPGIGGGYMPARKGVGYLEGLIPLLKDEIIIEALKAFGISDPKGKKRQTEWVFRNDSDWPLLKFNIDDERSFDRQNDLLVGGHMVKKAPCPDGESIEGFPLPVQWTHPLAVNKGTLSPSKTHTPPHSDLEPYIPPIEQRADLDLVKNLFTPIRKPINKSHTNISPTNPQNIIDKPISIPPVFLEGHEFEADLAAEAEIEKEEVKGKEQEKETEKEKRKEVEEGANNSGRKKKEKQKRKGNKDKEEKDSVQELTPFQRFSQPPPSSARKRKANASPTESRGGGKKSLSSDRDFFEIFSSRNEIDMTNNTYEALVDEPDEDGESDEDDDENIEEERQPEKKTDSEKKEEEKEEGTDNPTRRKSARLASGETNGSKTTPKQS
jgi:hypothetical protein